MEVAKTIFWWVLGLCVFCYVMNKVEIYEKSEEMSKICLRLQKSLNIVDGPMLKVALFKGFDDGKKRFPNN